MSEQTVIPFNAPGNSAETLKDKPPLVSPDIVDESFKVVQIDSNLSKSKEETSTPIPETLEQQQPNDSPSND